MRESAKLDFIRKRRVYKNIFSNKVVWDSAREIKGQEPRANEILISILVLQFKFCFVNNRVMIGDSR